MQKRAKKWTSGALLGTAAALAVFASASILPAPASSEKIDRNFIVSEPEIGLAAQTGEDPYRALVFGAAENPGNTLKFAKTLTIRRNQTLMEALTGAGVERREAYFAIEALSKSFNPRKIPTGQKIAITLEKPAFSSHSKARLYGISMPVDFGEEVLVKRTGEERYASEVNRVQTRTLKMYAEGTIDDSLYLSALAEGVPLGVVSEVIRLFSFDVDFQREIWSGDGFKVFYERRLTPTGEAENTGKVLAATLILKGKPLTFYRFEGPGGKVDYYTADGKSARKMLMKTPVDGARLSSRFGSRKHPVLGYTRMHKGVDFAAVTGTPIMAAGDGVIERASRWGSFGNYIRIRHNGTYQTAYAHLSGYAKGIRSGVRVKQGQVIGYVGATGRVTGAHLHYEIFKDGTQINPLNLKMPKGESLSGENLRILQAQVGGFELETGLIQAFFSGPPAGDEETRVIPVGD